MIFHHKDYRSYLKSELAERSAKNKSYSLRAFARNLKVSPSTLSEVLNSKRNISVELAQEIAGLLGLAKNESEYFYTLVELEGAKSLEIRANILQRLEMLTPLMPATEMSLETFSTLEEWYYIPLMEMAGIEPPVSDTQEMAHRLQISREQVEQALDKLLQLQLLERTPEGRLVKTHKNLLAQSSGPNMALRKFNTTMLERTKEVLHTQTNQEKFVGWETFAFDSEKFAEATDIIEECFSRLVKLAAKSEKKDTVYFTGIQFFKVVHQKQEAANEGH